MVGKLNLVLGAGALLSGSTLAGPSADTLAVCKEIYQKYPNKFAWNPLGPNSLQTVANASQYQKTTSDYWNIHNQDLRSACIFYPSSADDVSFAVKSLNKYPSTKFALHSGGHMSNLGFSAVEGGVQFSFKPNLANTTISADRQTADVGPGSTWDQAMTYLDQYGKAIVGGRLGHVGVAGYTIGTGLSFLTSQYGFASDTVTNFEVVLADGSIVNANSGSNQDLFWALKGGGNNYGIVTKFTFKTFTIGQVWGGTKLYTADKRHQIISAVANYTSKYPDAKSAIIPTFDYTLTANLVNIIVVFYFYDGPTPPKDVFAEFDAAEPFLDQTKTSSYPELLIANNEFSLTGMRYQIREGTFPAIGNGGLNEFLNYHWDTFNKQAFQTSLLNLDVQVYSFAVQPIPASLVEASERMGGNAAGLSSKTGDHVFIEYDISWSNPLYDEICPKLIRKAANDVLEYNKKTYAGQKPTNYQSGDVEFTNYNPIFMNDAMYDQPVLRSYGDANYNKLKAAATKYDPNGFFATRTGGFKFDST